MAYYAQLRWCINRTIVGPFQHFNPASSDADLPALLAL